MPTYSYKCKECNHKFEAFQSMKAEALTECPECQGPVERLIGSGAGIVFKGSGFYVTDYKKSSSQDKTKKTESSNSLSAKDSNNKAATATVAKD